MTPDEQTFNKLAGKRNLYLISQTVRNGYDTYSDAVVAAWSEEEASNIHPDGHIYGSARDHDWMGWDDGVTWAADPKDVKAVFIGVAEPDIKGVVCASFHAG